MIGMAAVLARVPGLDAGTLELWVAQEWVRPARRAGQPVFAEIDVARLHLIVELRQAMEVGDSAMPVVLSLLDQLHATRRQLRLLHAALEAAGPEGTAESVVLRLRGESQG